MTTDPLLSAALLGTARSPVLPLSPDPTLEVSWQAIPRENPTIALLHALALVRTLHRAGVKSRPAPHPDAVPSPQETRDILPPAAVDAARRLLAGESPEFLTEWVKLAEASGKILPARLLPDLLASSNKNSALRQAAAQLSGERGPWLARRHQEFAWLLESGIPDENAWDEGSPAERIAWLRHTRATDPTTASEAILSHWKNEDSRMREAILRLVADSPTPSDESWLESQALSDKRMEIRDAAATALVGLPGSAFRRRALERARPLLRVERRLLRRTLTLHPPPAFDPSWATDGIREKPPQGTGEKAWWLRQAIAQIPLEDWPALLQITPDLLFSLPLDPDWRDAALLGWIDSAIRMPHRAIPHHFLPFLVSLDPWPFSAWGKIQLLSQIIDSLPVASRFAILDQLLPSLSTHHAIELLARIASPPPSGHAINITNVIDKAIHGEMAGLTRPQARSLAATVPAEAIQGRLELIAKLKDVPGSIESFATALEFRRTLIQSLIPT